MVNWKKWFLEEDEDEIFEEEVSRKEKKDDSLAGKERKTADKRKERVYYEDEEDFEIDFSSKKSKRTFEEDEFESDFGNRRKREKTQEKFEDYEEVNLDDFEIDEFEDEDYEEDFEQERKSKKGTGLFAKFKNLFKQNDEEIDDDFLDEEVLEEDKDDEAEDYKTYLERQKREQKEKAKLAEKERSRVVKEENFEDYEEDKKVGFFSRLKDKLFNVSEDEIDQEELEAVLDDYEEEEYEEETPVKKKPQVSVERFDSEPEEELEIEFVDEVKEEAKFEEIDITKYEEKEEKASAGTVTDLGDALKKLGVTNSEITDVDIFDEKPTRRKHPTLAAVRTKRLKQDHKIDELGDSVVLGKDSSELKQEVATSFKGQTQEETQVQEERVTKNKEARKEFEENFNSLERRRDTLRKTKN